MTKKQRGRPEIPYPTKHLRILVPAEIHDELHKFCTTKKKQYHNDYTNNN